MRRALVAAALLAALLLPAMATAQDPQATLPDIEDEVMCTVCGTTLQLSNSPQATRERAFINDLIAQGLTKDEIKDELVVEYGADVLAVPDKSGAELTAWLLPLAAFILAAVGIALAARRWRSERKTEEAATAPESRAAAAVDPDDDERLRADLRRYEV